MLGTRPPPHIVVAGDRSLLVRFASRIDAGASRQVRALLATLLAASPPAFRNLHPAYATLLLDVDTDVMSLDEARGRLLSRARAAPTISDEGRTVVVPVCYGGAEGPDLGHVARSCRMTEGEVAALHSRARYRVSFLGFSPGFPYLEGLPDRLATHRRASPRPAVPPGSVAIGGTQTGVYPVATPGGWNLIGRTPLRLFDPHRTPAALLAPGDTVRFRPTRGRSPVEVDAPGPAVVNPRGTTGRPALEVLAAGFATTVQDSGRPGWTHLGVSACGAADPVAIAVGNALVGNPTGAAALEMTLAGASFRVLRATVVALSGATAVARVGSRLLPPWTAIEVPPGAIIECGHLRDGARTYLCIAGGVEVPAVLGSRSTHVPSGLGGVAGRRLRAGDVLASGTAGARRHVRRVPASLLAGLYDGGPIRVTPGVHVSRFASGTMAQLTAGTWRLAADSDRTGLRLEGPRLPAWRGGELVTEGVPLGVVQVPSGGQPIVLFVDHQTTGGYPQLACVVSADLHRLGQLRPGDGVRFERIQLAAAAHLAVSRAQALRRIVEVCG